MERPMKKIIATLLALIVLFSITSCSRFYEPVESTEEEARTVMTLKFGNKTYEVRYELYRAFFLTYKSEVDGGDESVWVGDNKDEYVKKIDAMILDGILEIYSTLALAESLGIDPYSTEVGKKVNDYVNMSVEGGDIDGVSYPGYKSYEDYLASLKELNLNYSVQTLLFRYAIVADMIDEYYIGKLTEEDIDAGISLGQLKYTEEDVHAFYGSEDCVRLLRTFVSEEMSYDHKARAERVRDAIASVANEGEDSVRKKMIAEGSTTTVPELENGYTLGRHTLLEAYYGKMVDAAFSLDTGEVSEVVTIHDGTQIIHYILYRAEKSEEHYEQNYSAIAYVYLRHKIGCFYNDTETDMRESVVYTDFLKNLDRSGVSMGGR